MLDELNSSAAKRKADARRWYDKCIRALARFPESEPMSMEYVLPAEHALDDQEEEGDEMDVLAYVSQTSAWLDQVSALVAEQRSRTQQTDRRTDHEPPLLSKRVRQALTELEERVEHLEHDQPDHLLEARSRLHKRARVLERELDNDYGRELETISTTLTKHFGELRGRVNALGNGMAELIGYETHDEITRQDVLATNAGELHLLRLVRSRPISPLLATNVLPTARSGSPSNS
jgi:hypothetical protein